MNLNVLITGGAGFIGYHLAKSLVDLECTVTLVDNFSRGQLDQDLRSLLDTYKVNFHDLNLLETDSTKLIGHEFDLIFHFAAILGVQNVLERPFQTLHDNVLLLNNAITIARKQKQLRRFVFTSTSEVYAGSGAQLKVRFPTPEPEVLAVSPLSAPRTSYMLSKIYGEAMVHHAKVSFTIVRPHNIYGPRMGDAHVVPQLLRKAFFEPDGGTLKVYSTEHMRTFCYVDDAIEMLLKLATTQAAEGCTVNIGSQSPEYTMREVGEIVIKTVGKDLTIEALPPTKGSPVRRAPDTSLLGRLTGYQAVTSFDEGVGKTFDWYRKHSF